MSADITAGTGLVIHGQHVMLRESRPTDIAPVLALIGDQRVTRWLSFDARDRQQAHEMVAGVAERRTRQPRFEYCLAVTPGDGDERNVGFARLGSLVTAVASRIVFLARRTP